MKKYCWLAIALLLPILAWTQVTLTGCGSSATGPFRGYDIPPEEVGQLWILYSSTTGPSWIDRTNWFENKDCSTWAGLTVGGGNLTEIYMRENNLNGDVSAFDPSVFTALDSMTFFKETNLSGDLSGWTFPAALTDFDISYSECSGDLSSWTLPVNLEALDIDTNNFSGDISGWSFPANLEDLWISENSFTGDISSWDPSSTSIRWFDIGSNNFSGDISGWTFVADMRLIRVNNNSSISGDISSWVIGSQVYSLWFNDTSLSGTPDFSQNIKITDYCYDNCSLSQANVDSVLLSVYNRRMALSNPYWPLAYIMHIGGTNATPSGVYQDGDPPTTGKEYIYELENDPESEGFRLWEIDYTP